METHAIAAQPEGHPDVGTDAERALREYERKIACTRPEDIDLVPLEEELRALLDARGREMMAKALKRADTDAPEVEIDGQRWGNRRVHRGERDFGRPQPGLGWPDTSGLDVGCLGEGAAS